MPSYKVIQSGHIIEIYEYQSSVMIPKLDEFKSREGGRLKDEEGQKERKDEYRKTVNTRAYAKLRRLINANFDGKLPNKNGNTLFVTLTYAEHVTDIKQANYDLKKFLQKMKRRYKNFMHVTVLEFTKKGRIHYHMLCNAPITWKDHEELQSHERYLGEKVWKHGFVDIGYKDFSKKSVDKNLDNAGAYLLKYMTKDHIDERLDGNKRYFFHETSNNQKLWLGKKQF